MHTGIAQTVEDALRHRHLLGQCGFVLRRFLFGQQHQDLTRPISHGRQPDLQAQAGGVPQGHGHQAGGQALHHLELRAAAHFVDQLLALPLAVQQQRGIAASCGLVGLQQGPDFCALLGCARVGISERPGRTGRGARPTAHAQVGVDDDLLARDI